MTPVLASTTPHPLRTGGARRHRLAEEAGSPAPLPVVVLALGALAVVYVSVPLLVLVARVPWSHLVAVVTSPQVGAALLLSLVTCVAAVAIDLLVGVPAALVTARARRGGALLRVVFSVPLALPPVVAGVALLTLFGRHGPVGVLLEHWGVRVVFTVVAVVMAQVFVSLPFLVATVDAALRARSTDLEDEVAALGATPAQRLCWVTLPAVRPALVRGTCLALARCLGEFGATLTFAGSRQGVTRTMPLEIYLARESDSEAAVVLAVLLLTVAVAVVGVPEVIERGWWRVSARGERGTRTVWWSWWWSTHLGHRGAGEGQADAGAARVEVDGEVPRRAWRCQLVLEAGTTTVVMGPNGAGKSTLAQVVAGGVRLGEGRVRVAGRSVDSPGVFLGARDRRVALLGQVTRLLPWWDVMANVTLPLRVRGWDRASACARAREALERVGAEHLAPRLASRLSGGERARVALARALVMDPAVLVLDEPTAALDAQSTSRLTETVAELSRTGRVTILLVTHDVGVALALADRLVVMEAGQVAEEGAPGELMRSPRTSFTAHLAGVTLLPGHVESVGEELVVVRVGQARVRGVSVQALDVGEEVRVSWPAAALRLARDPGGCAVRARVASVTQSVGGLAVDVVWDGHRARTIVPALTWAGFGRGAGDAVGCEVDPSQVTVVRA